MARMMVRRSLLAQPVLCIRAVWDSTDPDSGAGVDLEEIRRRVREAQQLEQAGPPYICVGDRDEAGLVRVGLPRWIYHTNPTWNLLPDDHLIELLWPVKS
jgi:hypothetical protein